MKTTNNEIKPYTEEGLLNNEWLKIRPWVEPDKYINLLNADGTKCTDDVPEPNYEMLALYYPKDKLDEIKTSINKIYNERNTKGWSYHSK